MANIDLVLKDISDTHVRENFFRLQRFVNDQIIFDGDFKLFDITIPSKLTSFKVAHGLTFIPSDIIVVSSFGNFNFYFRYQDFDKDFMYITTNGPVRIRFLAGKLKQNLRGSGAAASFPLVAPGDIILPGSPGFVFGAVNDKTDGFWLTSEGIPSNVVGIPVLFGDGVVIQAAIGTQIEANYTIGIFQHEGAGLNTTLLGQFDVVSSGPKRISLNFPIQYTSPNVQIACQLITGNTTNLKVSLIIKGSSI